MLPVVSGQVMSVAVHGHTLPLVRLLGRPPEALMRKVPNEFRVCGNAKGCGSFRVVDCQPCMKMPDCYEPPGLDSEVAVAAGALVALAWRDGIYVVLVEGPEFSL
jgi:hypothetical protein